MKSPMIMTTINHHGQSAMRSVVGAIRDCDDEGMGSFCLLVMAG